MKWFICSLIILNLGPCCVLSEVQLFQPGSKVVKPGESLSLTCRVSLIDEILEFEYYEWGWVRQAPGKGLEWMGHIYPLRENASYVPKSQSRITISADPSTNETHLQLSSMTPADTATYYCVGLPQ